MYNICLLQLQKLYDKTCKFKICQENIIFHSRCMRKTFWTHSRKLCCPVILPLFQVCPCAYFSHLWRDLERIFLGETEPSCMSELCVELITLDKPILTSRDMEHLDCYDTKHFHLFLILIFRSNSPKQKDASNSLSLSRQNATWLWMPGAATVLHLCFGPFYFFDCAMQEFITKKFYNSQGSFLLKVCYFLPGWPYT